MKDSGLTGIRYSLVLGLITLIILFLAEFFHVQDPVWALISGVICCEFDIDKVRVTVFNRIFATLTACLLSVIFLFVFGPGHLSVILGIMVIAFICYYAPFTRGNWKLAVATGVLILLVGFQRHSLEPTEEVALKRALEVVIGSLLGASIAQIFNVLWSYLIRRNLLDKS